MSFRGVDPYGTPGGSDDLATPFDPPDVRLAVGQTHITYLLVNGPLTVRNKSAIEQVVRTLTSEGGSVVSIVYRDDGAIIDANVTDTNFGAGVKVSQVSPGVTLVEIPANGITAAMITNAIIDATKLASNAVTNPKIATNAVDARTIADSTITPTQLASNAVTNVKIASDAVDARTIANGAVTSSAIAVNAVGVSAIQDNAVGTAEIANGSVTPALLDRAYADVNHSHNAVVSDTLAIGARNITSSTTGLSAINITLPPVPTMCKVRIVLRVEGQAASGPTNGGIRVKVVSNLGLTYAFQADNGVDSTLVAVANYMTSGGTSLSVSWECDISIGNLRVSSGYYEWDCYPVR